jgi:hypothetical protein
MLPEGFKPTIPESEQSQTHASDRAATRIGSKESMASLIRISFARDLQQPVIFQWCSDSKGDPVLNHHTLTVYVEMDMATRIL